ncbi:MAG: phosphoglycerate kinase [bacterium]|nr:phosphoglycerate kinase [bacterium]
MGNALGFKPMEEMDVNGKRVLIRVDINSPINVDTKKIVNTNRIDKTVPTLKWLLDQGAKLAIIAHQGDTLDYQNLIPLTEHSEMLSEKLGVKVDYIDDVCGPSALEAVKSLEMGEAVILGNLRYLCEEISSFENVVKLDPKQMCNTWLVRSLAPLFDLYINDAFAAAHRNAPSMVSFQELLPSAAGPLFYREVTALTKVMESPDRPSVFVLGGAKISDAFGMMEKVLKEGSADKILACGVTGEIFLLAKGIRLGETKEKFIRERSLDLFINDASRFLDKYGDRIVLPQDLAYEKDGKRVEIPVDQLPCNEMFLDVGKKTIDLFSSIIKDAGTVFVNGPAGMFENELFETGTKGIWNAIAHSKGFTVVGGGDSVSAAARFTDINKIDYICTAGGAMVRFLSGTRLPLIEAMKNAEK